MVSYIDDLDAKMNQVTRLIDKEPSESNWTGWQKPLDTKLYRKRIDYRWQSGSRVTYLLIRGYSR